MEKYAIACYGGREATTQASIASAEGGSAFGGQWIHKLAPIAQWIEQFRPCNVFTSLVSWTHEIVEYFCPKD